MKLPPLFDENASFSILDKSGIEVSFEILDNEAHGYWKKVYYGELTDKGATPTKNIWAPKYTWVQVLHDTLLDNKEGLFTWENVKLETTRYLTTQAGKQLLDYHGTTPERKYYMLRDYFEIIGAYYNLFEFWEKEKGYVLISVSNENSVKK